jgi:hypothetical protein
MIPFVGTAGTIGKNAYKVTKSGKKYKVVSGKKVKAVKKSKMIGANGPQVSSKSVWKKGKTERVDVENPKPGKTPGKLHYHDAKNKKWDYDMKKKKFIDGDTKELAPPKIQKLLKDKEIQKAIKKGEKYLNGK